MQLISPEQQLESSHHSTQNRAAFLKNVLDICFKNIVAPSFFPENVIHFASYLAISFIFLLDVITGSEVAFQLLYVFPVTLIALHSSRTSLVACSVVLSVSLQFTELLVFQNQVSIYLFFIIATSNSIVVLASRYFRDSMLEAKRLSTIDPLTCLCNRRTLDKVLSAEMIRQRRYGGHLSVVLLDLDGFKGLNDSKGHKAGDAALVLLADILRNHTRQTDTIARLGGDEFVILMPNMAAIDCNALCHLLCHTIGTKMNELISYPVTASIGFIAIENSNEVTSDILTVADRAMYQAKATGKGCVARGYFG